VEFLSHPIPAVIVLLGVLVFVHELGHFLAGIWCGAGVEIFSLGFGPRACGFKRGGTDYRLSWIPLGGFVKLTAMVPSEEVPAGFEGKEFYKLPVWKKSTIIAAGPLANFALAVVAYAILGAAGVSHTLAKVGFVTENGAAAKAGLVADDVITEIDGVSVRAWQELEQAIARAPEKTLRVTVEREDVDGQRRSRTVSLTPQKVTEPNLVGQVVTRGRAGVAAGSLPPVVRVLANDSVVAKAGLKNGDEITRVMIEGGVREVKTLQAFLRAIEAALVKGAKTVTLTVKDAPIEDSEEATGTTQRASEETSARDVSLSLAGLQAGQAPLALAKALGISHAQLVVGEAKDSLAHLLKRGDVISGWDGSPVEDAFQLHERVMKQTGPDATVQVRREGEDLTLKVSLAPKEVQGPLGKVTVYPLPLTFLGQPREVETWVEKYDTPWSALGYGFAETGRQTAMLVVVVGNLVTGNIPLKALGGPILIAKVAGDSAKRGWVAFLGSLALISVNLGLLNLFPIPVLDGGQLILFGVEVIRRRPVQEHVVEQFQKVGFLLLMGLILMSTYNDLARFWKSMVESVIGVFR
jgi:regulator of sigma E protease